LFTTFRVETSETRTPADLTTAEAVLWKNLQGSRLDGKKFRRQHSVGKYVLDFYCPECRLAVELDGEAHFTSIRAAMMSHVTNSSGV
jgi:very-short-patch-repair endonuclease